MVAIATVLPEMKSLDPVVLPVHCNFVAKLPVVAAKASIREIPSPVRDATEAGALRYAVRCAAWRDPNRDGCIADWNGPW